MDQPKIVILDGYTANPGDLSWEGVRALGALTVYDRTPEPQIAERIGDAAIVLTNKTPLRAATLDACPGIRYIGVLATGYNIVDTAAAAARGIPVTNVPTYATAAVAQLTFALLLEVCHHVGHHSRAVHEGRWTNSADFCFWDYPLIELSGKTIGLIGLGRIGRATADIARAFGMRVLAYDPNASSEYSASFEEVLSQSDVLSLHAPLTEQTQGIIGEDALSRVKRGVILINTSRGPLVDEAALRRALDERRVYAAALDVVSQEPIRADHPLLGCEYCIFTPHIAWAPGESRARLLDTATRNVAAFLRGERKNVVNGV